MRYYLSFLIALFFSYLGQILILPFLKRNLLDIPNSRSSHLKPVPKGGGLVFVLIGSIGAIYFNFILPLLCLPLSTLGLLDDKKNIPRNLRYVAQIGTSILLIINISENWISDLKINSIFLVLVYFCIVLFMTAIINFINFMDGLDGFISSCMLVIFLFIALTLNPALYPLCGSLLGFIFWNWHPAKVFMGDVGSVFLGSLFAGLLFDVDSSENFFNLFLCASPLIFDAALCIVRRFYLGQNIFHAHKLHLYQRLSQAGWSHSKVTLVYLFAILMLCLSNLLFGLKFQFLISILFLFVGVFLDKYYAYPLKK